jgi:hypothetical protein
VLLRRLAAERTVLDRAVAVLGEGFREGVGGRLRVSVGTVINVYAGLDWLLVLGVHRTLWY